MCLLRFTTLNDMLNFMSFFRERRTYVLLTTRRIFIQEFNLRLKRERGSRPMREALAATDRQVAQVRPLHNRVYDAFRTPTSSLGLAWVSVTMVRSNMDYHVENLLGNKEMPVLHHEWSVLDFLMNVVLFAVFATLIVFAGYFLKTWVGHMREQGYRRCAHRPHHPSS